MTTISSDRVHVIAGGYPPGALGGHDMDYARLRLLELLEEHGGEGYTFPVAEFPSVIQRALKRDETGAVAPFNPEHTLTRTQDLEPAFYDAGQFYWGKGDTWTAGQNVHANDRAIVLPEWRVVGIDTPDDWDRAERLYSAFTTEA